MVRAPGTRRTDVNGTDRRLRVKRVGSVKGGLFAQHVEEVALLFLAQVLVVGELEAGRERYWVQDVRVTNGFEGHELRVRPIDIELCDVGRARMVQAVREYARRSVV